MLMVTATDMKNNFGKYIKVLDEEEEIIITQYGKEVARLVSKDKTQKFLLDDLKGMLKGDVDLDKIREERAMRYYDEDND